MLQQSKIMCVFAVYSHFYQPLQKVFYKKQQIVVQNIHVSGSQSKNAFLAICVR